MLQASRIPFKRICPNICHSAQHGNPIQTIVIRVNLLQGSLYSQTVDKPMIITRQVIIRPFKGRKLCAIVKHSIWERRQTPASVTFFIHGDSEGLDEAPD